MANLPNPSQSNLGKRLIGSLAWVVPRRFRSDIPVVPVVRLAGVIGVVTPLRPGLLLSTIARSLERAFDVPPCARCGADQSTRQAVHRRSRI